MKKNIYVLLGFILILFSCQKESVGDYISYNEPVILLSAEELLSIEVELSPHMNEEEIFTLLKEFQNKQYRKEQLQTRGDLETVWTVSKKYYLNQMNTLTKSTDKNSLQIPIYEVSLKTGEQDGFAVISADRRAPHILAFIDNIDIEDTNLKGGANLLLECSKVVLETQVMKYEANRDSLFANALSKISDELKISEDEINLNNIKKVLKAEDLSTKSKPITSIPTNLTIKGGTYPLCPVAWGQSEPYNCKLPMGNCEVYFPGWVEYTNYPAGCGTVCVAHLFATIAPSASFSGVSMEWGYLCQNPTIVAPDYFNAGDPLRKREMVGYLFKEIYNGTKSSAVKNSSGVVTGTSCMINNLEAYMKNKFNCGSKDVFKIATIKSSLTNRRPIYVYSRASDSVYPFLIDGVLNCSGRINNVPKDVDLTYLHANFGFGAGYQDGYYLMELDHNKIDFETAIPMIFKSGDICMIPDIRKK